MHVGRNLFEVESLILALHAVEHALRVTLKNMRGYFRIIGTLFHSKLLGYAFWRDGCSPEVTY